MSVLELSWPSRVPRLLFRCRVCPLCSSIEFSRAELGRMDWFAALFCIEAGSLRQLFPQVLLFRCKKGQPLTLLSSAVVFLRLGQIFHQQQGVFDSPGCRWFPG